jgi:hypothetical protein
MDKIIRVDLENDSNKLINLFQAIKEIKKKNPPSEILMLTPQIILNVIQKKK